MAHLLLIMEIMFTALWLETETLRRKNLGVHFVIFLLALIPVRAIAEDQTPEEIYAAQLAAAERKARATATQILQDADATMFSNGDVIHYAAPSPPPTIAKETEANTSPAPSVPHAGKHMGEQNITSARRSRRSFADDNFRFPSERASGKAFLPVEEEAREAEAKAIAEQRAAAARQWCAEHPVECQEQERVARAQREQMQRWEEDRRRRDEENQKRIAEENRQDRDAAQKLIREMQRKIDFGDSREELKRDLSIARGGLPGSETKRVADQIGRDLDNAQSRDELKSRVSVAGQGLNGF